MSCKWVEICINFNESLVISIHSLSGFLVLWTRTLNLGCSFTSTFLSLEEIIPVDNEQLHLQNFDIIRLLMVSVKSFKEIFRNENLIFEQEPYSVTSVERFVKVRGQVSCSSFVVGHCRLACQHWPIYLFFVSLQTLKNQAITDTCILGPLPTYMVLARKLELELKGTGKHFVTILVKKRHFNATAFGNPDGMVICNQNCVQTEQDRLWLFTSYEIEVNPNKILCATLQYFIIFLQRKYIEQFCLSVITAKLGEQHLKIFIHQKNFTIFKETGDASSKETRWNGKT